MNVLYTGSHPEYILFRRKVTFLFCSMFYCANCQNENASLQTCALHFLYDTLGAFCAASLSLPNPGSQKPCSQTPFFTFMLQITSWGVLASPWLSGVCWHTKFPWCLELEAPPVPSWLLKSPPSETGSRFLKPFQVLACWELVAISVIQSRVLAWAKIGLCLLELTSFVYCFYGLPSLPFQ